MARFFVGKKWSKTKIVQNEKRKMKSDIEHGFLLSMDMLGAIEGSVLFKQESMKVRFIENWNKKKPTFTSTPVKIIC